MRIFQEVSGRVFVVITPEELETLPEGTVLNTIDGTRIGVKGRTDNEFKIDSDTRFGHLAYGFWIPVFNHDKFKQ